VASAGGSPAEAEEAADLWVSVKSRTQDRVTRKVRVLKWVFRATRAGVSLGRGPSPVAGSYGCTIEDPSLQPLHAVISLVVPSSGVPFVQLEVVGRTYLLIGKRPHSAFGTGPTASLAVGAVIKMGACSLKVEDAVYGRPSTESAPIVPAPRPPPEGSGGRDDVCYICFEGGGGGEEEDEEGGLLSGNPLMPSPCPCAKLVHRKCLIRWVCFNAVGARSCSICKGRLPIEACVEPPYLVLQVVRHSRGLEWRGEREHVLTFAGAGVGDRAPPPPPGPPPPPPPPPPVPRLPRSPCPWAPRSADPSLTPPWHFLTHPCPAPMHAYSGHPSGLRSSWRT